jgi:hypothetical protein
MSGGRERHEGAGNPPSLRWREWPVRAPHPAAQRPGKGKLVLDDGHSFPFGLKARLRGGSCSRQSSAFARNVYFPLD